MGLCSSLHNVEWFVLVCTSYVLHQRNFDVQSELQWLLRAYGRATVPCATSWIVAELRAHLRSTRFHLSLAYVCSTNPVVQMLNLMVNLGMVSPNWYFGGHHQKYHHQKLQLIFQTSLSLQKSHPKVRRWRSRLERKLTAIDRSVRCQVLCTLRVNGKMIHYHPRLREDKLRAAQVIGVVVRSHYRLAVLRKRTTRFQRLE